MRQKDIRTRVAEIEAEAKAPDLEGIETKEEDESFSKVVPLTIGLVMAGIGVYMGFAILKGLGGE